jgi:hypothetical protein
MARASGALKARANTRSTASALPAPRSSIR